MKQKNIILLSTFLLILLSFILAITACSNNSINRIEKKDSADSDQTIETTTEDEGVDAKGFIRDNIPDDLNFNGQQVKILYWEDVRKPEFYIEEAIGEIVNDAVYERRLAVESRLGVGLAFTGTPGNYDNQQNFVATAQNDILAGTGDYDIIAGYSMAIATLAYKRCTLNLLDYDIIDFDMPWWPDSLIKEARIGDCLYFASGDISPKLLYQMYGIFFNKNMIQSYRIENPYDLVSAGKWTIDKMIAMTKGIYLDLNGDLTADGDDRFGFISYPVYYDPFYFSAGFRYVDRDEDDIPTISPRMNGEGLAALVTKLCDFIHNSPDTYGNEPATNEGEVICSTIFQTGRGMFISQNLSYAEDFLRNADFEYGVVPHPKYTEEQSNYSACAGFAYTLYGISTASKIPDAAAAVLETLASEGYRRVTPAVFETAMKVKYSNDEESAWMYDIIREGVTFDLGRIFTASFNDQTYGMFRSSLQTNNANWVSTFEKNERVLKKNLASIVDAFMEE